MELMKVAIFGKCGTDKNTLTGLLAREAVERGCKVIIIIYNSLF
jgi:CO dehydrogenase nickel-insertion accessory protein CooC1